MRVSNFFALRKTQNNLHRRCYYHLSQGKISNYENRTRKHSGTYCPLLQLKNDKAWNGMLKIHLKNPTIDRKQLLCGLRVFALELDGCLTIAKVAKDTIVQLYRESFQSKSKVKP
jgi:hypothetical protein